MSEAKADLGWLRVEHICTGLMMQVSLKACFATSDEDACSLASKIRALKFREPCVTQPWVSRPTTLRLGVRIRCSDEVVMDGKQRPADIVATALSRAELWQQLCLKIVSVEHDGTAAIDEDASITLSFVNESSVSNKPTRKLHQIDNGVPFYDVKPPRGVHTLEMTALCLSIDLYVSRPLPSSRIVDCLTEPSSISTKGAKELLDDIQMPYEHLLYDPLDQVREEALLLEQQHLVHDESGPIGGNPYNQVSRKSMDEMDLLWDSDEDFVENLPHLCCEPAQVAQSAVVHPELMTGMNARTIDPVSLVQLLDSTIHRSFCGTASRLPNTCRITAIDLPRPLVEVTPALFSPGYMDSVASRAPFLSTISRVLLNFGGSHARSACLRSKLADVRRRATTPIGYAANTGQIADSEPRRSQADLSALLWRLTQESLYNEKACQVLKPIRAWHEGTAFEALDAKAVCGPENAQMFLSDDESKAGDVGVSESEDFPWLPTERTGENKNDDKIRHSAGLGTMVGNLYHQSPWQGALDDDDGFPIEGLGDTGWDLEDATYGSQVMDLCLIVD